LDFGFYILDFRLVDWNQNTQKNAFVIPGKLAIASATRNPGNSIYIWISASIHMTAKTG
jgi:hypothetical protein